MVQNIFIHKYKDIISMENLLLAWREFLKRKRAKKDVQEFQVHLMDNILLLHKDLMNKRYVHGGDYVIVTNIDKIKTTGRKESQKEYHTHSQYMGGLKTTTLGELRTKKPFEPLKLAVAGMLPKNSHRDAMLGRMKQFQGTEHSHEAQTPEILTLS
jgi:ribosomal protein L13